jgi:hypothetical protein
LAFSHCLDPQQPVSPCQLNGRYGRASVGLNAEVAQNVELKKVDFSGKVGRSEQAFVKIARQTAVQCLWTFENRAFIVPMLTCYRNRVAGVHSGGLPVFARDWPSCGKW